MQYELRHRSLRRGKQSSQVPAPLPFPRILPAERNIGPRTRRTPLGKRQSPRGLPDGHEVGHFYKQPFMCPSLFCKIRTDADRLPKQTNTFDAATPPCRPANASRSPLEKGRGRARGSIHLPCPHKSQPRPHRLELTAGTGEAPPPDWCRSSQSPARPTSRTMPYMGRPVPAAARDHEDQTPYSETHGGGEPARAC